MEYKKLLAEFISLKSISTDPAYKSEIEKTVTWLKNLFTSGGLDVSTLKGPTCNPIVFANYKTNPKAETVLIYGHYDVQPANKNDGWEQDPFTILEKDGKRAFEKN